MLRETFFAFLFIAAQAADEQMLLQQQVKTSEEFQTTLATVQESLMQVDDPAVHAAASMVGIAKARADGLDDHGREKISKVIVILENITKNMSRDRDVDQEQLERSSHIWCRSSYVAHEANFKADFENKQTAHEECRTAEAVLWEGTGGVVDSCSDLASWQNGAHQNGGSGRCQYPGTTSWSDEISGSTGNIHDWITNLKSWFEDHMLHTFANEDDCRNARTAKEDKEAICEDKQREFENAYCLYYWYVERVCCVVATCWNDAHDHFNTLRGLIKPNADIRVHKANAILAVICMLNSLLETPTMGDPSLCTFEAYEAEAQNRTNITYPHFPNHENCTLPTPSPDEPDRVHDQFYSNYGSPCTENTNEIDGHPVAGHHCSHAQKYDIQPVQSCPQTWATPGIEKADDRIRTCVGANL